MKMKKHLIDTFMFNDSSNKLILKKIALVPDNQEFLKLFGHLINCQYKWMARIMQDPEAPNMSWWDPVYDLEKLEKEWTKSLDPWLAYLDAKTDDELATEVVFIGFDNAHWAATPADIALQLNYHSIHHRAQMQTLLRQHGLEPDFVDYIRTKYRRLG